VAQIGQYRGKRAIKLTRILQQPADAATDKSSAGEAR
jgi:hypothetical protein